MPVLVDEDTPAWGGVAGSSIVVVGHSLTVDELLWDQLWARSGAPLYADNIVLTVTFDSTLARVQLVGSGLDQFTFVSFERSTNQVTWTTVRGGESMPVSLEEAQLDDYEFAANEVNYYRMITLVPFGQTSDTESITPTLDGPWLKSIARPFLNMQVEFGGDQLVITRRARGGVFDIVGRSLPVAVTDVRGSRQYTVIVRTETADEAEALDLLFASGDILFTHGSECRVPSGVYWYVGTVDVVQPLAENEWRLTTIEVVEVAAPGPDVVGATSTWQTVINTYATWADVIADKATWADLLELVGDGSEVIVP